MNNRLFVRRALQRALFAGCVVSAVGFVPVAFAQDTAQDTDSDRAVEEIVVTGSRLRRDRDFVAISPVQTIGLEQIQSSGNLTLSETLNEYPQLVPDNTSVTAQSGGTGVLAANLRNLGPVRTLVLVDGRRFIPADESGLTDLAAIPDMLIDRVEIVTGGASAVYGSDAIAGAINFILRDDFEGAEVRYQYGETTENDGANHKLDLMVGANVADGRGNVTLHGSYTRRDEVFFQDRAFSAVSLLADGDGVPAGSKDTYHSRRTHQCSRARLPSDTGRRFDCCAGELPRTSAGTPLRRGQCPVGLLCPHRWIRFPVRELPATSA